MGPGLVGQIDLDKPIGSLDESDELRLARPMVLIIGVAATLFAILVAQINDIFAIMIGVVNTFGAPLLAIFPAGNVHAAHHGIRQLC